ncbi:MAG: spore germination protein GerW family protein [Clostridiales bacterium]|nr:spore germination protein GerW family protein [Clostridiales bacterium]
MSSSVSEMLENAVKSIDSMVESKKIIGDPITTPDGTVIVPVSQVSLGFGGGGADFDGKNTSSHFGGGMGGGAKITPQAFLVISNGNVRLISAGAPSSPLDKVIDLVPDMVDKINGFFTK